MIKHIRVIFILFFFTIGHAQEEEIVIEAMMAQGYESYIEGDFETAITVYLKALEMDPTSALANSQIAMSYFKLGDYDNAILYSEKVIQDDNDPTYVLSSYVTKGSCLDIIGETDASIELFKEGIEKFPENNYLHFNLGINYFKLNDVTNAEYHAVQSATIDPGHLTSHFLLANINHRQEEKIPTLLTSFYFLLAEPHTEKSVEALDMVYTNFSSGVTEETTKEGAPININITLGATSEFGSAELMLSLLEASKSLEKNKDKSEDELFIENTTSFFTILGDTTKETDGLWKGFYIPFFYKLAQSEHMETFCHYVQQSKNENSIVWLKEHEEKINAMFTWLNS
jgi:tetratricopeptide (TPR) repeat protein